MVVGIQVAVTHGRYVHDIAAMMFLKPNISLIPNNPIDVTKSPIWNTLIPSHHVLPYDIDDFDDNEKKKDDDEEEEEDDNGDEEDDLSPLPLES